MFHRAFLASSCAGFLSLALTSGTAAPATPAASPAIPGCFATGEGYLRARLRGAVNLDLDWKDADMDCAGGPRPPGKNPDPALATGVRVSIGGPLRAQDRRIRIVFGIGGIGEGSGGHSLPTNVTVLFEGEQRVFATLGDDKCTVDSLTQQRVENLGGPRAVYRVVARGFCLGPATSLSRDERVFLTSFDFAGRVEFDDEDRHALTNPR